MSADGPLWCRVDGRELLYDLELALGFARATLVEKLSKHAQRHPPAGLITDLRMALAAMPDTWRTEP